MITTPAWLLEHATAVLDGTVPVPGGCASRSAALLSRQALEELIRERCRAAGVPLDNATGRSRLTALRVRGGAGSTAADAAYAWAALSRACHHHAYELTPTDSEVRHLIGLVRSLAEPSPPADEENER